MKFFATDDKVVTEKFQEKMKSIPQAEGADKVRLLAGSVPRACPAEIEVLFFNDQSGWNSQLVPLEDTGIRYGVIYATDVYQWGDENYQWGDENGFPDFVVGPNKPIWFLEEEREELYKNLHERLSGRYG